MSSVWKKTDGDEALSDLLKSKEFNTNRICYGLQINGYSEPYTNAEDPWECIAVGLNLEDVKLHLGKVAQGFFIELPCYYILEILEFHLDEFWRGEYVYAFCMLPEKDSSFAPISAEERKAMNEVIKEARSKIKDSDVEIIYC